MLTQIHPVPLRSDQIVGRGTRVMHFPKIMDPYKNFNRPSVSKNVKATKTNVKITSDLDLNVASRTVRRAIAKNLMLVRRKMKRAPALTNDHKRRRIDFA